METESMQSSPVEEPVNVDGVVEKKIYEINFVKYWPRKDQNVKSRIEESQKVIVELYQETGPMMRKHNKCMLEQLRLNGKLRGLWYQESSMGQSLALKTKDLDDLLQAADKLNFSRNAYSMLHGSNNLSTEKQILRQIKECQERGANDGSVSSIQEFSALTSRMYSEMRSHSKNKIRDEQILHEMKQLQQAGNKSIIDHIRLINKISEEIRKDNLNVKNKIKRVKKELEGLEKDIDALREQIQVNREILPLKK